MGTNIEDPKIALSRRKILIDLENDAIICSMNIIAHHHELGLQSTDRIHLQDSEDWYQY